MRSHSRSGKPSYSSQLPESHWETSQCLLAIQDLLYTHSEIKKNFFKIIMSVFLYITRGCGQFQNSREYCCTVTLGLAQIKQTRIYVNTFLSPPDCYMVLSMQCKLNGGIMTTVFCNCGDMDTNSPILSISSFC